MSVQDPIHAVIWHCLDNYDYKNALFLTERLYAESETDETVYLLATCYYRAKQVRQSYWLLKKKALRSPNCRYLQARCAFELQEFVAAEKILTENNGETEHVDFEKISRDFEDKACFVFQLLGKIYSKVERVHLAVKVLCLALQLNPFMWQAYEELCNLGVDVKSSEIFSLSKFFLPPPYHCRCQSWLLDSDLTKNKFHTPVNNGRPFLNVCCSNCSTPVNVENVQPNVINDSSSCELLQDKFSSLVSISPVSPVHFSSEKNDSGQARKDPRVNDQPSDNFKSRPYAFRHTGNTPENKANQRAVSKRPIPNKENKQVIPHKPTIRATKEARVEALDAAASIIATSKVSKDSIPAAKTQIPQAPKKNWKPVASVSPKSAAIDDFMAILCFYADGFHLLCTYQCKKAIKHFEDSSFQNQLKSTGLQRLIAKCYYEMNNYSKAADIYRRMHEMEPYRFEHMDIYSSCLWQLGRKVELSTLAQDLLNYDRLSPITWFVIGNCFSLEEDHGTAIKMLKRAVQLDANGAYGYTVLGHEYVLQNDMEQARFCYYSAIARDQRQYNAWFGIGSTFAKEMKHRTAEFYYRKAHQINPYNSVILVHVAAMQYAQRCNDKALISIQQAVKFDPQNLAAKLQRAKIFFALNRHSEALEELENLKKLAPTEATIFRFLGLVHQAMDHQDMALMYFSWSTDMIDSEQSPFQGDLPASPHSLRLMF